MTTFSLTQARATDPGVAQLIATHFALMRSTSPEESCHVMPADALDKEGAFILAAQDAGATLGLGALKVIEPGHGEIKSMHTSAAARGQGIARHILHGLIEEAQRQGLHRLSLETGSADMFAPARALYASEGFTDCAPFGDYVEDPLSVFMTRTL